jgi:Spy/CpxP family protein refolding chaperone
MTLSRRTLNARASLRTLPFVLASAALSLPALVACGGSAPPPATPADTSATTSTTVSTTTTTVTDDDDPATDGIRDHHRHHHGGVSQFIALSIETLGVSPEQKAKLSTINDALKSRIEPAHQASRLLIGMIADGVAVGNVDKAKVDGQLAVLAAAAANASDASTAALDQLHAVLDAGQRAALVDKVEANWHIWRDVNHEEKSGSQERNDRLADFAQDTGLSADETAKLSAALQAQPIEQASMIDPSEMDGYMKTFRAAFVADSFDAKTLGSANAASAHVARAGAGRMAHFYEVVTPLLTPEQRTKVAAHLRDRLNPPPSTTQ